MRVVVASEALGDLLPAADVLAAVTAAGSTWRLQIGSSPERCPVPVAV
jgi:hypothetical protein